MNESRDKAYFLMSLTFLAKPSTSKQRIIIQVIRTPPSDNGTGFTSIGNKLSLRASFQGGLRRRATEKLVRTKLNKNAKPYQL